MVQPKPRKTRKIRRNEPPEEPTAYWQRLFDLDQIEAILQASAAEARPISYSETLGQLGMNFSRPKMRALCAALGEVDRRAAAKGQPELAVLVVRASDLLPGQGWWVEKDTRDYKGPWEGPRAEKYIKGIQRKAYDYWCGKQKI